MNNIKSLRNFGTIYLWIFAFKVLQVCGDGDTVLSALLMKPYAYQIFDDDYTDDATPLWQTLSRQQHQLLANKRLLPLIATKSKAKNGNSPASKEITFENLNDFYSYKIKNTIWPKTHKQQQHYLAKVNSNGGNDLEPPRHSLQQYFVIPSPLENIRGRDAGRGAGGGGGEEEKQKTSTLNFRFKQNRLLPIPIIWEKHFKVQATKAAKKSKTPFNAANTNTNSNTNTNTNNDSNNNEGVSNSGGDNVKENLFPSKDDNSLNVNDVDDDDDGVAGSAAAAAVAGVSFENEAPVFAYEENGISNSNGNGNESFNYADNNEANNNYIMAHTSNKDHTRDSHLNINGQTRKFSTKPLDKRARPSIGHTPFLPAVSGGAMTNLGKFFRDLSKNVHVNEQYQWSDEEQKLLEGDPNFSDMHHHLNKPDATTDEQTAEWIKAIRFYRPSQKIRSLVAMNPHGQWAHNSQFIDPNYMWVGLGK